MSRPIGSGHNCSSCILFYAHRQVMAGYLNPAIGRVGQSPLYHLVVCGVIVLNLLFIKL